MANELNDVEEAKLWPPLIEKLFIQLMVEQLVQGNIARWCFQQENLPPRFGEGRGLFLGEGVGLNPLNLLLFTFIKILLCSQLVNRFRRFFD